LVKDDEVSYDASSDQHACGAPIVRPNSCRVVGMHNATDGKRNMGMFFPSALDEQCKALPCAKNLKQFFC